MSVEVRGEDISRSFFLDNDTSRRHGCNFLSLSSCLPKYLPELLWCPGRSGDLHYRTKRGWIWNQFFVLEEHIGPEPQYVGKYNLWRAALMPQVRHFGHCHLGFGP
uniref:Uncharacterized protein n=1 Tax=Cyclopterus lumpus TaxID=8103 RepID=A0A8C3AEH0_CYCLU